MATQRQTLEFEKPIAELERQIDELKRLAGDRQLNVAEEIAPLERKLGELREEIYRNLTPIQRVQVARNPRRPFTVGLHPRSRSPISSSCTAIALSATTRRSSAAGRGSTARR